ncbi:MAG: hypothetical protein JRI68_10395 [Deltaproteobacteria bacterium]|nr:hypothetical protein [Deltaproteobacteria bacterium]
MPKRVAAAPRHQAILRCHLALLLALAGACWGCGPSEEKREAQAVLTAIDKVRKAEHRGRAPLLAELDKLQIKGSQAVQARTTCATAYRALDDAEAVTAKAEKEVAAHISAGVEPPTELLTRLEEVQKLLDGSEAQMPACQQAIKALKQLLL